VAALLLPLLVAAALVETSARRPWDFETYWLAVKAAGGGFDPYDPAQLGRLAGRFVGMPFVYPPITLLLFAPVSLLPLGAATTLWLAVSVAFLVLLVEVWRRFFLPGIGWLALVAAAALGFNAAAIWGLKTGNVAILEQALLWCGLAAYARDRRTLFAALVLAAAIFKLMPIAFLALLLVPSRNRGADWKLAAGALAVFLALVFLPAWLGPGWGRHYLTNLPSERPWGEVNPSALGLIDTVVGDHAAPLFTPPYRSLIPWGLYVAGVGLLGARLWRSAWRVRSPARTALLAALLYALVAPRLMAYSYLIAIPPILALVPPLLERFGGVSTVAAALSAQAVLVHLLGLGNGSPWTSNLPFFVLLAAFLLLVIPGADRSSFPRSRGEEGRAGRRGRSPRPAPAPRSSVEAGGA
jgi:Glycosyltransferase family 87